MNTSDLLQKFLVQASSDSLKTSEYPKEWEGYKMKVSFGMGAASRVPWIGFTLPEYSASKSYFPNYLYYKDLDTLVLAFGVSETYGFMDTWPEEISNKYETVKEAMSKQVKKYAASYVFRSYTVTGNDDPVLADAKGNEISPDILASDLRQILRMYRQSLTGKPIIHSSLLLK